MPVVRAGLLPHQEFGAVLSTAPTPPPRLPHLAASRLPLPCWSRVAPDIPSAAPAVTLATIRRAPSPINLHAPVEAANVAEALDLAWWTFLKLWGRTSLDGP